MACGFSGVNKELLKNHCVIWVSERSLGVPLVRNLLWLKSKASLWPESPMGPDPHYPSHQISWLSLHHAVSIEDTLRRDKAKEPLGVREVTLSLAKAKRDDITSTEMAEKKTNIEH